MANYLLAEHGTRHNVDVMRSHDSEIDRHDDPQSADRASSTASRAISRRVRSVYHGVLKLALGNRRIFVIGFMAFVIASFGLAFFLGENFFPTVDSGEIYLHVRAPIGTRIEERQRCSITSRSRIRTIIPADQIDTIVDNIGLPVSGINRAYSNDGGVGPEDGDILVTLNEGHDPTAGYVKTTSIGAPTELSGLDPSRFCRPTLSARFSISVRPRRSMSW